MSSPLVHRLGSTLCHSLWQGAVIAVALMIALGFAYRAAARVRYGLACVALMTFFLLPPLTFLRLGAAGDRLNSSEVEFQSTTRAVIVQDVVVGASTANGLAIFVGLWLAGVVLLSLRLMGSVLLIERWRRRRTRNADAELVQRVARLAERVGVPQRIRVLVADDASVPSAWGVFRPVITVPLGLLGGLPPVQIEAILLHELMHIRRFDYVVNLLQTVVETLLFFHPATWWISSLIRREREHCCDDAVVAFLGDPLPYARALLHVEERRHALPQPALSARGGSLMNRIQRILARPAAPSRLLPVASAIATLGIAAVLLGGALQAQAKPQTSRTSTPKPRVSATKARASKIVKARPVAKRQAEPQRTTAPKTRTGATTIRAPKVVRTAEVARGAKSRSVVTRRAQTPNIPAPKRTEPQNAGATYAIELKGDQSKPNEKIWWVTHPPKPPVPGYIEVIPTAKQRPKVSSPSGKAATSAKAPWTFSHSIGNPRSDGKQSVMVANTLTGLKLAIRAGSREGKAPKIEVREGAFSVEAKSVPFLKTAVLLAQESGQLFFITSGKYADLDLVSTDLSLEGTLDAICRAGNATWHVKDRIYYISPYEQATPKRQPSRFRRRPL